MRNQMSGQQKNFCKIIERKLTKINNWTNIKAKLKIEHHDLNASHEGAG